MSCQILSTHLSSDWCLSYCSLPPLTVTVSLCEDIARNNEYKMKGICELWITILITAKGRCESSSVRQRSPLKTAAHTLARNTTTSVDKSAGKYSVCPNDDYKWFLEVIECIKRNHYRDNIISKTRKTLINWGCGSPVPERRGAPPPLSPTEDARVPNTTPPLGAAREALVQWTRGTLGIVVCVVVLFTSTYPRKIIIKKIYYVIY